MTAKLETESFADIPESKQLQPQPIFIELGLTATEYRNRVQPYLNTLDRCIAKLDEVLLNQGKIEHQQFAIIVEQLKQQIDAFLQSLEKGNVTHQELDQLGIIIQDVLERVGFAVDQAKENSNGRANDFDGNKLHSAITAIKNLFKP